jgi:glycosyltransferase involved in cell wall biosynthesis
MLLSILIPTLEEREPLLSRLLSKLHGQIERDNYQNRVEIHLLCDNREMSTGAKRNALIDMAKGEFVAFVDDDDDVHEDYIRLIVTALSEHPDVDCLGITGLIYFRGGHPHRFVHSLQYDQYFSRYGVYYRPPYILNPIRRTIAQQFRFAETSYAEDAEWAMRIAQTRALCAEHFLDVTLYQYFSRRSWFLQWSLDITEPLRHPLGLQFANGVRWKRWLFSRL